MQDAWRAYLGLAMGLTEAPRKKAQDVVRRLVGSGEATATQLQALAEELLSTGVANREALTKLVRFEVDRALGAVGLAAADEVAELTRRVHELERQLREAKAGPAGSALPAGAAAPAALPTAGAAEPTGTAAGMAEPTGHTAPDAVATQNVAKKTVAKKTVAKKTIARKPPATVSRTGADEGGAEPARPVKAVPRRQQPGGAE
ncbi:phasin family protein [Micromonospora rubida]|uniref:phasin family protein n=1 Tax=Micromonospora rubida TaxID=2697657 RepID=UPI00137815F9|nr:hypothetical protein [Micromonospora rubida]NBE85291.1 hypothetical protein [Micromonospora rubida]